MSNDQVIHTFDTTLRDGTQGESIAFSVEDKLHIARKLDEFGIDYIEGGWPGSNPKDEAFFNEAKKLKLTHSKVVAFGSTRRAGIKPERDGNLNLLLKAETPAVSLFGKSWGLHVEHALRTTEEENLQMIFESVEFLKLQGREVIYDAEHFFDGYKDNPDYAIRTIQAAHEAGADVIVLCDTNGGTLPHEITQIVGEVNSGVFHNLGIHAHNDCELAVANTLAAVMAGARHVQGTMGGFGERCGNTNLIPVLANLQLKMGFSCVTPENMEKLVDLSNFVYELANLAPPNGAAYVGKSAFTHKGGIHVSAVMKTPLTYEHIMPETVGNRRRVLVSDLSGKSNINYKFQELDLLQGENQDDREIVSKIKQLENQGYSYEAAEASFELLVARHRKDLPDFFELSEYRINVDKNKEQSECSEASVCLHVNDRMEHTIAKGDGPVNALDKAMRKALLQFYPEIEQMRLVDYKVRVLSSGQGTATKVRVLIESQLGEARWSTIGVSANIIEASGEALVDSFTYFLYKYQKPFLSKISGRLMPFVHF